MPTPEQFAALMADVSKMDGRAAALVLSAIIDNLLEYVILSRFRRLSKRRRDALFRNPTAPLVSMSAKTHVAYAMGIVGDELRSQLDRMRSIRNTFAHAMLAVSFDDPQIAAECMKLDPRRLIHEGYAYQPETDSPRERFTVVATLAASILMRFINHRADELRYGPNPWRAPSPDKFELRHPRPSQNRG
jgi:hypothetical protein